MSGTNKEIHVGRPHIVTPNISYSNIRINLLRHNPDSPHLCPATLDDIASSRKHYNGFKRARSDGSGSGGDMATTETVS